MKVIILAGGSGTRLWPLSRERYPKQFIKLEWKNMSLFQDTFSRSLLITGLDDIYIVTNEKYRFLVSGEIEELGHTYNEENIIVEPEARSTLPAIYAGVLKIIEKEHGSIVVFPSDHIINNEKLLTESILASEVVSKSAIITFGIRPHFPNTGYGYICGGEAIDNGYKVDDFKEKPDTQSALDYIEKGYYWNSGILMFESSLFVKEVKQHAEHIHNAFVSANNLQGAFSRIEHDLSIDCGILEKSDNVAVVPVEISWSDLGSFDSFFDVFPKDKFNNVTVKDNLSIDSYNNLIHSYEGKLIATVGVSDLIVVDSKDALLICKREHSQKVKDIVQMLTESKDPRTEYHVENYRPWGHYKVLEEEKNSFKIRKITVNPGRKLSYQLHHHRSEHWIVVKGMARVIVDGEVNLVASGESIYIKPGHKHQLENPGRIPLQIVELQLGDYVEEDDIIRFDEN